MKDVGFELGLKCPYMSKDGYCTELRKPCPYPNDHEIAHIIERIRNCPYAGLFNTVESKTTAVLTLFFKSMGFDVEIDYSHASKYMDTLTVRGYRDGKMVYDYSFTESRRQIRKRIETLRVLFYALISTV